jgi:hypothetical protein
MDIEPLGDWIEVAPWKSKRVTLLDIDGKRQALTLADKRELLVDVAPASLWAVWTGQWSSHARAFNTTAAVDKVAELLV